MRFQLEILVLFLLTTLSESCIMRTKRQSKVQKPQPQFPKPPIRFNDNGKLKLVNFADLHFGEAPDTAWGPLQDFFSAGVMTDILAWEHPDFVIFTGDQLTAESMFTNGTQYVDILVRPLVSGNYRWASVYGNHDVGPNVTRESIFVAEKKYNLSYTHHSPQGVYGITNYFLPVFRPKANFTHANSDDSPVMIWWFFDSRGGRDQNGQLPEHVDTTVVSWFEQEHLRLANLWGPLPSLAFMHIPTDEYQMTQEEAEHNPKCSGLIDDDVTPQDRHTGILQALLRAGTVSTVFVGHDHGNAWCCFYKTLELCFNRHTGYGGYGSWSRGARVIDLDFRNLSSKRNYVRMESGEIIDEFPKIKTHM